MTTNSMTTLNQLPPGRELDNKLAEALGEVKYAPCGKRYESPYDSTSDCAMLRLLQSLCQPENNYGKGWDATIELKSGSSPLVRLNIVVGLMGQEIVVRGETIAHAIALAILAGLEAER